MSKDRINYTTAQQTALVTQVDRVCPLCSAPLFYKKNSRTYKNYEIAHIYPLNPKPEEKELLKNEKRLSEDVNHENNVIPLCKGCHGKFDKPRTIEEYRNLFSIKKKLIARSNQEEIWSRYSIEAELGIVIDALYSDPNIDIESDLEFTPKTVDEKLDETITRPTHRKIKTQVRDYYVFIKEKFSILDQSEADLSETISLQVKTYYLKQKRLGLDQQEIYENIVAWINAKTKPKTMDASEIMASFFVQNCEVF
ncbi:HNH endonuclease [Alteromonadaceae bacterium M269]|nr:HNH endonuclease [Alteromonadaceae bacterium M269]